MCYLSNICFMCFKEIKDLQTVDLNNPEDCTVKQINSVLPEIMSEKELELLLLICSTCQTELHSFYTYKKLCLANYYRLKHYAKQFEVSTEIKDCDSNASQNSENNIEQEQKKQLNVDLISESSEERNYPINFIDVDNICIKEEIKFDDNEKQEVYEELLSDIKEESVSEQDCFSNLSSANVTEMDPVETISDDHSDYEHENRNNSAYNQNLLVKVDSSTDIPNYSTASNEMTNVSLNLNLDMNEEYLNHDMNEESDMNDLECKICHKTFVQKGYLKIHLKRHAGITDYCHCPVCNKKFVQKSSLVRHMKIHKGIRDVCSICGKEFTQRSSLSAHMKVHTGVLDFECPMCNKMFMRLYSLQRHMKTHTNSNDINCSICGKEFRKRSSLGPHMKTHTSNKMRRDIQN